MKSLKDILYESIILEANAGDQIVKLIEPVGELVKKKPSGNVYQFDEQKLKQIADYINKNTTKLALMSVDLKDIKSGEWYIRILQRKFSYDAPEIQILKAGTSQDGGEYYTASLSIVLQNYWTGIKDDAGVFVEKDANNIVTWETANVEEIRYLVPHNGSKAFEKFCKTYL